MPRKPRFYAPGIAYHVSQSVGEQGFCFHQDGDYHQCLEYMLEATLDYDCKIHAYALAPGGFQLLIVPGDRQGIPRFMQSVSRRYVAYFNHRYQRYGPLWNQRYKASAIDADNYLVPVSLYIELGPDRVSGMGENQPYRFSSYHCNALGKNDGLTIPHPAYTGLAIGREQRQARYLELASKPLETAICNNIKRCLTLGLPLGSPEFKQQLAQVLNLRPSMLYSGHRGQRDESIVQPGRDLSGSL